MKKAWFEDNSSLFSSIEAETKSVYPHLHFYVRGQVIYVTGSFPVQQDGIEVDRFQVEIQFPSHFPRGIPRVRETGMRIPRIADRHMYPDGTACLFVDEEWIMVNPEGTNWLTFLNGPVRNFFIGQCLVEAGEEWPFGQRSHGARGILECYVELTGTNDLRTAYNYLQTLSKKKIKGHWPCPCGSGRKICDCHQQGIRRFKERIPRQVFQRSWKYVQAVHLLSQQALL
jgi:hypothetical protein